MKERKSTFMQQQALSEEAVPVLMLMTQLVTHCWA
jgi:hypothetical protein